MEWLSVYTWPTFLKPLLGGAMQSAIAVVLALELTALLLVARRVRKDRTGVLTMGGMSTGMLWVGRIVLIFLTGWSFVAIPFTQGLAILSLISLPFDAVMYGLLRHKGRSSASILPIANIPLVPPGIIPFAIILYALAKPGTRDPIDQVKEAVARKAIDAIHIGDAVISFTYATVVYRDQYNVVKDIRKEWHAQRLSPPSRYPIYWSPSQMLEEVNPHVIVCGMSGGGKSTFTYHLIASMLRNHGVLVLDKSGEYLKLAVHLFRQGYPVRIYDVVLHGIDIFRPIEKLVKNDGRETWIPVETPDQLASSLSEAISSVGRQQLGISQHVEISKAFLRAYSEGPEGRSVRRLAELIEMEALTRRELGDRHGYEAMMSLLMRIWSLFRIEAYRAVHPSIIPRELSEFMEEIARRRTDLQRPWRTQEPLGTPIPIGRLIPEKGELVVVSLSGIPDADVDAVLTSYILRRIANMMRSRPLAKTGSTRKFLVIDEAWRLLQEEKQRSIVQEMLRESRKYGIGIVLVTQRPTDVSADLRANVNLQVYFVAGEDEDIWEVSRETGVTELPQWVSGAMRTGDALVVGARALTSVDMLAEAVSMKASAPLYYLVKTKRLFIDGTEAEAIRSALFKAQAQVMESYIHRFGLPSLNALEQAAVARPVRAQVEHQQKPALLIQREEVGRKLSAKTKQEIAPFAERDGNENRSEELKTPQGHLDAYAATPENYGNDNALQEPRSGWVSGRELALQLAEALAEKINDDVEEARLAVVAAAMLKVMRYDPILNNTLVRYDFRPRDAPRYLKLRRAFLFLESLPQNVARQAIMMIARDHCKKCLGPVNGDHVCREVGA